MKRNRTPSITIIVSMSLLAVSSNARASEFETRIKPFLSKHCIRCHGESDELSADINLKAIQTIADARSAFELWESIAEVVESGDMPPEDEPQPAREERAGVTEWYQEYFVRSVTARSGPMRPRRLAAHEYRNTLRSIFGFDLEVAIIEAEQTVVEKSLVMKLLPTDPPGPNGFKNDTSGNPLTIGIWEQYSYLVDFGLERLFSPAHIQDLERYSGPIDGELKLEQARRALQRFVRLAYRRELNPGSLEKSLSNLSGHSSSELADALRAEMKAALMSPGFIYRGLLAEKKQPGQKTVDAFELAERLSYFFWSDMPDDKLLQAASRSQLSTREELGAQIDRMLKSPKSRALAEHLGVEWFSLGEIKHVSNNPPVADALFSQPIDYLNYLFTAERPLTELLASDFTFVSAHTAKYYPRDRKRMTGYRKQRGIEVEALPNQRLQLEQTPERGGLLTMPGVLAMNKGPVLRGTWVLERILGEHLPEPPADVGQVAGNRKGENLTFRQRFEAHRSNKSCAICHDKIDPLGFALQSYDSSGVYRNSKSGPVLKTKGKGKGKAVPSQEAENDQWDTSGRLPSGETFNDFQGLRDILISDQRERVVRNIVEKVLAYALCRKLEIYDQPTIQKITRNLTEESGTFRDLFEQIVNSLPFREAEFVGQQ